MPAAELSRLRAQINLLIERFDDPQGLRAALRELLDLYANRAYRPGQAVQKHSLLPSYRVPPLVMQQLTMELGKTCREKPLAALGVVDALWQDAYLEPRTLATLLLGILPMEYGDAVAGKLRAWARPEENTRMLDALFENGTAGLRRADPARIFPLVEEWLSSANPGIQALGLRALAPLTRDPSFENLPAVFRLISPLLQSLPPALQTDLQITIRALAEKSPTETAYFLRQALGITPVAKTARFVRRCLPYFSEAQQASLRKALQAVG
jgi:hypothetical protein